MIHNYAEARQWLDGLISSGIKLGLSNTERLLAAVGNPHHGERYVHVAGTNGKGSVCCMLAGVLGECLDRVGLSTSPHLVTVRERLRLNLEAIEREEFAALLEEIRAGADLGDGRRENLAPSYFEMVTVLGLLWFARRRTDLAIMEVGMGGRLDSTNVIVPAVSVITNIDFDHMRALGNTLALIAGEKAGIIKPGVPVVCGEDKPEAVERIAAIAAERDAPLYLVGRDFQELGQSLVPDGDWVRQENTVRWQDEEHTFSTWFPGRHQARNLATALATLMVLRDQGLEVDADKIARGLATVHWPARLQRLPDGIILDGAHNAGAICHIIEALRTARPNTRFTALFGCLGDKHWQTIIDELAGICERIHPVFIANRRAVAPEVLHAYLRERHPTLAGEPCASAAAGLDKLRAAGNGLVIGSLYLAGAVLECYGDGEPMALRRGL